MILYNVTVKVDPDIEQDWLRWMKEEHIPEVMETGLFLDHRFLRMESEEAAPGNTYAIQYWLNNMDDFIRYQNDFAAALQAKHSERYKDKYVAFRTLIKEV